MKYFDIHDEQIANRIIIENDLIFAFPSYMPIVPGHTLICPKRVFLTMEDATVAERDALFVAQIQLKKSMKKVFQAEGFNYAWNENTVAGQSVDHLHLHMLPRKKDDRGIIEYEPREFLYRPGERAASPEEELIEIARLIKNNL